ncbi:MAG TPA: CRISPR-associated protein Csx20 [Bacteroidales bacterium]|nr:CRISPR-associated protein Csx20 [Bacteroidales bacterium]
MIDENVLYIDRDLLESKVDIYLEKIKYTENELEDLFNTFETSFYPRKLAENDRNKKQIISYCIIVNENNEILTYTRKGNEKRLHNLMSIGIGGHINDSDIQKDFYTTLYKGTIRELEEELPGIHDYQIIPLGIINEELSSVGHVHTGFVCVVKIKNNNAMAYSEELSKHVWLSQDKIKLEDFEYWSQLALELFLNKPKKIFLLFSHTLTQGQEENAKSSLGITNFVYIPKDLQKLWSKINPQGSLNINKLSELLNWISSESKKGDYVLVQGDFGAVVYIVHAIEKMGLIPIYATTKRQSKEMESNGVVEKTQIFKHEGFRRYRIH